MQEETKKTEVRNKAAVSSSGVRPTLTKTVKSPDSGQKKKMSGGTLLAIVLILAIIAAVAAVSFNLGGAKQALATALGFTTVEQADAETSQQALAAQAEYQTQQENIKSSQESLSQKEGELNTRESELDAREQALSEREAEVSATVDAADQQAQRDAQLDSAAEIFAQMDPTSAAKAISGMDSVEDMAQILMRMPSEKAALIMEKMSSSLATQILSVMVG